MQLSTLKRRQSLASAFALTVVLGFAYAPLSSAAPGKSATATKTAAATTTEAKSQHVVLGDKLAEMDLTPEFIFVGPEKATAFLKEQGSSGEGVLGLIAPADEKDSYLVICRFEDVGYVNDDDAEKLNANDILNSYKEGTSEQNEERKELKLPPIFVGDWAEKPRYEKAKHQVVWAIEVKDEDSATAPVSSVNYNTRMLGRRGVLSMNLVTDPKNLNSDKPKVVKLLNSTNFIKGQTYAEYVPGKDKSAGFGIAGLILGGGAMAAAAKFGVFGVLWKWGLAAVLILKKFLIVGVLAVGGLLSKFFKKKPTDESTPTEPPLPPNEP